MKLSIWAISLATSLTLSATSFASEIDLKASTFQWTGSKKVGGKHTGKIFLKSATADFTDATIKSGTFVMDMTSFTVEDLEGEWAQKFAGHVKSADFFEVGKYPTATLKITKSVDADTVAGTLTIKAKTQPVQVDFKRDGKTFTGTMAFDRTKFGIVYGSKNFFKSLLGDKIIEDMVQVDFQVVSK